MTDERHGRHRQSAEGEPESDVAPDGEPTRAAASPAASAGSAGVPDGEPAEATSLAEASSPSSTAPDGEPATASTSPSARPPWGARSHLLVAVLCAALGFALVVQVRQTHSDSLALLRQDDLVRLLDEITERNDQLEQEQAQLVLDRNDLESGVSAAEVAARNAEVQAILAGTVPVQGPGVEITVRVDEGTRVPASSWVNLIEELRNAGAEAIEIDDVRVGASTWVGDTDEGTVVDGQLIDSPVLVRAIGDPQTLEVALEIPGGALPTLRSNDARTDVRREDELEILSVRTLRDPQVATPAPDPSPSSG